MANFFNTSIDWVNGQIPSLERVVKKIDESVANGKSTITDQIIVEYDRSKGTAEKYEKGIFKSGIFSFKRQLEYYKVDVYQNAGVSFSQQYKIQHVRFGAMEIIIKFSLGARSGGECMLVKELMRRDTPSVLLQDRIKEWVTKEISDDLDNLFTNFGQFSTRMTKNLMSQAAGIGLWLDATVNYKSEDIPTHGNIRLSSKEIIIQPKAYNDFLKLGFDVVLIPDKELRTGTLIDLGHKNRSEFQALLIKWMQEYIRDAVTYNEITSYLHFKVRTNLIDFWNKQLRINNRGWIVAELVLSSGDVPPSNFKFERMEIEVALRNAKIPLINTIILNLEDAERFKNQRVSNLESWIKEKLQQTAQNILARVSYAELVSRIDQLGSIIKSDLDKQASQIGYRVEYLLTSELVDNSRLNFQFQFSENEQVYQTSLNDTVKLNIIISGRIRSLDHDTWRSTLTPQTDFILEMKKEVLRVVRQMLLRINADDFYTKFTESVEPKLVSTIKDILVQQFNVDHSVDIAPKMELSSIGQLILDLQRGQDNVTVNFFNDISFQITFSVAAVDPSKWSLFVNRNYASAIEVKQSIGERIRKHVINSVQSSVRDIDLVRDSRFFKLVTKYAREADLVVREKLGLIIDIIDVEEISNGIANMFTKTNLDYAKEKMLRLHNAVRKIDDKILDALENGDDEWELEELKKKKKQLIEMAETEKFEDLKLSFQSGSGDYKKLLTGRSADETGDDPQDQDA